LLRCCTKSAFFRRAQEFSRSAHIKSLAQYRKLYREFIKSPDRFLGKQVKIRRWSLLENAIKPSGKTAVHFEQCFTQAGGIRRTRCHILPISRRQLRDCLNQTPPAGPRPNLKSQASIAGKPESDDSWEHRVSPEGGLVAGISAVAASLRFREVPPE
jgi:hypothetical protein